MQDCQLTLTAAQHQLLFERKTAIESKYAVSINTPGVKNFYNQNSLSLLEMSNCASETMTDNGIYVNSIAGEHGNVIASKKYIMEALLLPEIIEFHSYDKELKQIFCCKFWTEVVERIHGVCISNGTDYEVNISGKESSVASAVSYLQKLTDVYSTSSHCLNVNSSLSSELSKVLRTFRREDLDTTILSRYPECVKELLLSWLKEAYPEHFHQYSCTGTLNGSFENFAYPSDTENLSGNVQILEKAEVSVIVIDSDSDKEKVNNVMSKKMSNDKKKNPKRKRSKAMRKMQKHAEIINGVTQSDCIITATTHFQLKKEAASRPFSLTNLPDFIPLCSDRTKERSLTSVIYNRRKKKKCGHENLPDALPLNCGGSEKSVSTAQSIIAPLVPAKPRKLRPIVIDGSNVAMAHGGGKVFSCHGIALAIEYFQERGHTDIIAFVPQSRRHHYFNNISDRELLDQLAEKRQLVFTPSRRGPNGVRITCYDDRFIVDLAARNNGVIVSNDCYNDLLQENPDWKKAIQERLLMFCFVGNLVMFPDDPLGPKGPRLKEFLSIPDE